MYFIQHCLICRPSDSTASKDARIEPRTVATSALAVRGSNHSATYRPQLGYISSTLGYISSTLGYISSTLGYISSTLGYISSISYGLYKNSQFEYCQRLTLRRFNSPGWNCWPEPPSGDCQTRPPSPARWPPPQTGWPLPPMLRWKELSA